MGLATGYRRFTSLLCVLSLAGCVASPPPRVAAPVAPHKHAPKYTPPSAASQAVHQHYVKVQAELLAQGMLRTDGGGRDTPFNERILAENFIRIALYDEYARGPSGPIQRQTESRLRRWEVPVRAALRFGNSVSASKRATERAKIGSYLARLSRITGHPISLSDHAPNFIINIVNEDERRALGPAIANMMPGLSAGEVAGITDMPLSTYCLVYAMSEGDSGRYTRAVAVLRAEHPDLLNLSCIHEELAQAMGLANDSPRARPSIFNDDEEFALLTRQDELMLKMLYNPALRPGMTEAQARPIVESLARALMGGQS
jgi:hypothetical protein